MISILIKGIYWRGGGNLVEEYSSAWLFQSFSRTTIGVKRLSIWAITCDGKRAKTKVILIFSFSLLPCSSPAQILPPNASYMHVLLLSKSLWTLNLITYFMLKQHCLLCLLQQSRLHFQANQSRLPTQQFSNSIPTSSYSYFNYIILFLNSNFPNIAGFMLLQIVLIYISVGIFTWK